MNKIKLGPCTLLIPMPSVLVGAMVGKKPNFMTASWCSIAASKPPSISVALRKERYTLKGIQNKKMFSINIPSSNLVKKVDYCGIYSGKKIDKSKIFGIFFGRLKTAPLIEECLLNLECKSTHILDLESHLLVIGEIVETYITENCLTNGKADPKKIDPLVYSPGVQQYYHLGEVIAKAFDVGKNSTSGQ